MGNGKLMKDIVIAGAGPTGLAAALEAAGCGYNVMIAAPSGTHLDDDSRTTALMAPGTAMLADYGVWEQCQAASAPLKTLRIIDATGRLFRAPPVSFRAREAGYDSFGHNIANRALNAALEKAVHAHDRIEMANAMVSAVAFDSDQATATLSDGRIVAAKLIVGADGTQSLVRQASNIGVRKWSWPQTAVVAAFDHERGHDFNSTEFHTEQGPFTQVPLPGNRSSLVWVMRPERAQQVSQMTDTALAAAIEEGLHWTLGKVSGVTAPQLWPLSSLLAHRFAASRVMLIGQAAHAFPPIGAQGLNLGFRDVADLARVLSKAGDDPGARHITASYDMRRRVDVYTRTGAVDLLNRSLLTGFVPVQMARAAGLSLLRRIGPLRGVMMREGVEPGSGLRACIERLAGWNPLTEKDQAAGSHSSSDIKAA